MEIESNRNEHGQNLIIFAVFMVVLVALAGLVVDGGFSLTKRREAQNAADAGALAGAEALCSGNPDNAEPQALEFAIDRNGASAADVLVEGKAITVTTTIPHETFLAGIFGSEVVTITASASAGCYVPCELEGVLPVAWACQPPAGEDPDLNECGIEYGTVNEAGPLYVFMDSQNLSNDFYCQDPPNSGLPLNTLDCDLDDNGINELMAGGNRSWLDLSGGGGGAAELKDWIWNGFGGSLSTHMWFGGQAGVENSVFQAVGDIIGTIVWLPVFDSFCLGVPDTVCPESYHTSLPEAPWQDTIVLSGGTSQTYFHVIAYSALRITCVVAPGVPHTCPDDGRDAAVLANPELNWNSIKTIEGYFIENYGGSGKCEGPDTGIYTIYLNH